jgi:hypothetical protein
MTKEEISKKIDSLYKNEKARNFFNHLVRGYFPVSKVEKVMNKPVGPFKCVITNENLISTSELLQGIQTREFEYNFHEHLKSMFDESSTIEHPMAKLIGNRIIGVTSQDTTTNMAYSTYQVFYEWIITKMLTGDKHINWVLKDMQRTDFMGRAANIDNPFVKERVKNFKKTEVKQATTSLGDFDALKALKAKMESGNS